MDSRKTKSPTDKKELKQFDLVKVIWEDAVEHGGDGHHVKDFEVYRPTYRHTIGIMILNDNVRIVVATIDDRNGINEGDFSSVNVIPWRMINKVVRLIPDSEHLPSK